MLNIAIDQSDTRLSIGGNNPPSALEFAPDTMQALSDWMKEHPAVQSEDDAREAKKLLDRAKACAGDIEDERDGLVRPLNTEISEINGRYKSVHNTDSKKPGTLDKVISELKYRLADYIRAEEERRRRAAEEAENKRLEAERIAREAEAKEREAIENAKAGELGVDVTQVVVEADSLFAQFQKASREAARAERETNVKIGGGWGKSASLRTIETLILDNALEALVSIGVTEKIKDAILSAARDYRKLNGTLPKGVSSQTERKL